MSSDVVALVAVAFLVGYIVGYVACAWWRSLS
jgi:uncharacterized membrane protein YciS (DUF1049 family)